MLFDDGLLTYEDKIDLRRQRKIDLLFILIVLKRRHSTRCALWMAGEKSNARTPSLLDSFLYYAEILYVEATGTRTMEEHKP